MITIRFGWGLCLVTRAGEKSISIVIAFKYIEFALEKHCVRIIQY